MGDSKSATALTRRDAKGEEVYNFVVAYWREHGHAPANRDITKACSISSTSVTAYYLARLARQGRVSLTPLTNRTLRPVGAGCCPLCGCEVHG